MDVRNDVIVWPSAMCIDENRLWIYHGKINALFMYEIDTDRLEYVCHPSDEDLVREYSFCSILRVSEYVYMIPCWGNHIHIYDLNRKEERIIDLPDKTAKKGAMNFCKAFVYNGKVYCVPANSANIIVISPVDNSISFFADLPGVMSANGVGGNSINDADIDDTGRIIATISGINKVIVVNIPDEDINILNIADSRYRCSMAIYRDGYYYISTYKQDEKKGVIFKYDLGQKIIEKAVDVPYSGFVIVRFGKKHIIADSYKEPEYIIFDENLTVARKGVNEKREYNGIFGYSYCHGITVGDEDIDFYFDRNGYKLYRIEPDLQLSAGTELAGGVDLRFEEVGTEMIMENPVTDLSWLLCELNKANWR